MPDAGSTDQQGQQPPPPPGKQIDDEISLGKVVEGLGRLFGADWETTAGGGGTGGKFMFASVAELDAVIAQWEREFEAIRADGDTIDQVAGLISPPAEDTMSKGQAAATHDSLLQLKKHNTDMRTYADEYIKKLKDSRAEMVNTEQGNAAQLRHTDGR